MAGYKAFQETFMRADLLAEKPFADFEARKLRYAILWGMYENTAYRNVHTWAQMYKTQYGLYRYTRAIYNPSYRLGEFWKTHLMGGALDPAAGDGKEVPSALPIIIPTENPTLRNSIATLWQDSNWQINKDIMGLWGPVLGDTVLKIIDDPAREKVYLKNVHPGTVKDITLDDWGNIKAYVIEEKRANPKDSKSSVQVTYREEAARDGVNVVYRTYLDDRPYAWNPDTGEEWEEPYGFIPMVVVQHNNVGLSFGWSEIYPGLSKFREVDDLASKLSDQIRKMVDPFWLFAGVAKPKVDKSAKPGDDENSPEQGREELPAIWAPDASARAQAITTDLNVADTSEHIKTILADIERDYPELNSDMHNVQGEISGRALRINREPSENKVQQRRPNYDNALVRAHQMAIAIGGFRGYEGYQGFDLDSYDAGALDHSIGARPVFAKDPLDDIEREQAFWTAANVAKSFGIPPLIYLKRQGWSEEDIAEIEQSEEYQLRSESMKASVDAMRNAEIPVKNGQSTATGNKQQPPSK